MTRENGARYPQVTRGVNKLCSQFVLCRRGKERPRFICLPLHYLFTPSKHSCFQCFGSVRLIIKTVLGGTSGICSDSNCYLNRRVTSNQQLNNRRGYGKEKKPRPVQRARSNHRDKERVWALAQELLILGELARPTASKCITYGVPFSQLPQREHKTWYISPSKTNQPRYAEEICEKNKSERNSWKTLGFIFGMMSLIPASKPANEAVLPLILLGVSQETGLPGWLSALIKPDGFLTLNNWIECT